MPPRANFSRSVPKIEFDPNNPTLTQSELQFAHEVTHILAEISALCLSAKNSRVSEQMKTDKYGGHRHTAQPL